MKYHTISARAAALVSFVPLLFFIASPLLSIQAFAAPNAPQQSVFLTQENPKKGEAVQLNALVYNQGSDTVKATVSFLDAETEIGTAQITIPPRSAQTAMVTWTFPSALTEVTVFVTAATDSRGRTVSTMIGQVGTASFGKDSSSFFSGAGIESQLTNLIAFVFEDIEPWRLKQAERFADLRDRKRAELGISTAQETYSSYINNTSPEVPALPGGQQTTSYIPVEKQKLNVTGYATLLYATSMSKLFSSMVLFYVAILLGIILIIRWIISVLL